MNELRPTRFNDLVGQDDLIENLNISVKSATKRDAALAHTLFAGPPGLGKTTLACALANELDVDMQTANGANLRSIKSLMPYLKDITKRSILFIDEIHRMTMLVEEFLYPIMEDFRFDMSTEGKGKEAGEVKTVKLPPFTILGATTEAGALSAPLRDRFSLKFTLELYDNESLATLLQVNSIKLKLPITARALKRLAQASRGTPRIANALLQWVRDFWLAKGLKGVRDADVEAALKMKRIGADGSTREDRRYLNFLKKQNGPIGVRTIASSLNINQDTIEQVIEPFLLSRELIQKTSKGRIAV
jgi:Holliday junction DNA helicase RuvB